MDGVEQEECFSDVFVESDDIVEVPVAYPHAVNGAELADSICEIIQKHMRLSKHQASVVALWCIGTYCMGSWRIWPKLLINSPQKRCGKTTLLTVVEAMCLNSFVVASITPAVFYRVIEKYKPTILIDEGDISVSKNDELNAIINAGHTRRTSKVVRCGAAANNFEPEVFDVWAPQVIAAIGVLKDTLHDRSIIVPLERKSSDQVVERLPVDFFEGNRKLRSMCLRWSLDSAELLANGKIVIPSCGNDRAEDNWLPLFALTEVLGGQWPEKVRSAYVAMTSTPSECENVGEVLLSDISGVITGYGSKDVIFSRVLVSMLNGLEDAPWSEFSGGKRLTQHKLANLLKPFRIRPTTVQQGSGSDRDQAKGYKIGALRELIRCYVPQVRQTVTSLQTTDTKGSTNLQSVTKVEAVTEPYSAKARFLGGCNAVTDSVGGVNNGSDKWAT